MVVVAVVEGGTVEEVELRGAVWGRGRKTRREGDLCVAVCSVAEQSQAQAGHS